MARSLVGKVLVVIGLAVIGATYAYVHSLYTEAYYCASERPSPTISPLERGRSAHEACQQQQAFQAIASNPGVFGAGLALGVVIMGVGVAMGGGGMLISMLTSAGRHRRRSVFDTRPTYYDDDHFEDQRREAELRAAQARRDASAAEISRTIAAHDAGGGVPPPGSGPGGPGGTGAGALGAAVPILAAAAAGMGAEPLQQPESIREHRIGRADAEGRAGWWIDVPADAGELLLKVQATPMLPVALHVAVDGVWVHAAGPASVVTHRTELPEGKAWLQASVYLDPGAVPPMVELWVQPTRASDHGTPGAAAA